MGGMNFGPRILADSLSETAGYKSGLALSVEELCDHLSGTTYPDIIRESEESGTRLRSEEYEALFYKLLYRIGYTAEEYDGDHTGARRFHKYKKLEQLKEFTEIVGLFAKMVPAMMAETKAKGTKLLDPRPYLEACVKMHGRLGLELGAEQIEVLHRSLTLNPHSASRSTEWRGKLALRALFAGTSQSPERGRHIDQRFVDYLSRNPEKMPEMHWRKFEQLAAEFFDREGYKVELGPGSNDDGVDVRVWKPGDNPLENPLCLIQCKRQKSKVERVVVKGLQADVEFEGAEYGLIVTTSELSPGARSTISARGYAVREVDRNGLNRWLEKLRTPGTGIVRV